MNIVYALTRNIYYKLLPSIRSLAEHNPDARVFILCEDDSLPFELPIPVEVINISGQEVFPDISENREKAFGGYINHLKLCYPSLLPVEKVVHLDVDTIICDSLDGLWDTDVDGRWFAAVPECQTWYRPYGDTYYNMGVALFNLKQLRDDNAEQVMVEFLLSTDQPFADQNAWNKFGTESKKISPLNLRYNESQVTGTTQDPAIVHYCSYPNWYENPGIPRREYLNRYL